MSKNETKASPSLTSKKKKMSGRKAKLKTSSWYEDAARSVGISRVRPPGR